jgi:hypothetical protein
MEVLRAGLEDMWLSDDDYIIEDDSDDERKVHTTYHHCVLSIDIGIKHLGLSVTLLNEDYSIMDIIWLDLIDIQIFTHKDGPSKEDCKLNHTKTFCDWINHVFQENMNLFDKADTILIERQPPMGLVGIEQLIFSRWREKAVLISPNSMHKFFRIGHYDYEQRKVETEKIAQKCLNNCSELVYQFNYYERKHDIADSLCMMLFWINKKQIEYHNFKRKEKFKTIIYDRKMNGYKMGVDEWFEQFRYTEFKVVQ